MAVRSLSSRLVLSLFPGIGLLDLAFETEGFTVVRGPDILWGGDVRRFHVPSGRFDGVIGGPPCQDFSIMRRINAAKGLPESFGDLVPEYSRVVGEARPAWFVMEQVPEAPVPSVEGYRVHDQIVCDHWVGGRTMRKRRFSFGTADGRRLPVETLALHEPEPERAVTGNARVVTADEQSRSLRKTGGGALPGSGKMLPFERMLELQGLPADFLADAPFTEAAKRKMIGNGVPLPLGRAIARAVLAAMTAAPAVAA